MSDFPQGRVSVVDAAPSGVISTVGPQSQPGAQGMVSRLTASTGAVWPSANLAIYVPVLISEPVTIYQLGVEVTTQAGNLDLGIYDESGARLVSVGSTLVAVAGLQTLDITDTALVPGLYYWAMACSSATAAFRRSSTTANQTRTCGCQQQAGVVSTLPNPAVFAAYTQNYLPLIVGYLSAVTV